jgi:hypothetical protein
VEELAVRLRLVNQPSEEGGQGQLEAPREDGGTNENKETRELLDQISRDLREQKATKADDADIPEYLWEEHLTDDDARHWTAKDRVGLPQAMDMMRRCMLRHGGRSGLPNPFSFGCMYSIRG